MSDKTYHYATKFWLECDVNDLEAARNYLTEDNMTHYLKERLASMLEAYGDPDVIPNPDFIEDIYWNLYSTDRGTIELITNQPLTEKQLKSISRWVSGQNSDGLGEGFEQQDFACFFDEESYEMDGGEDDESLDPDDYCVTASFDWKNNDYIFSPVKA